MPSDEKRSGKAVTELGPGEAYKGGDCLTFTLTFGFQLDTVAGQVRPACPAVTPPSLHSPPHLCHRVPCQMHAGCLLCMQGALGGAEARAHRSSAQKGSR